MDEKPVVFILHGDDNQALKAYVDAIFARMGDPGLADLNTARLDGRTTSDEDLRTAVSSMPFLADRRLAILTHPLEKAKSAAAKQTFLALLDSIPETTALVLVQEDSQRWMSFKKKYDWERLHEDHWLMEWAHKAGKKAQVRAFSLPTPSEMPGWILKAAKERGGSFTQPAAHELAALINTDTRTALLEIEKLLTYVNFERPVEPEDVADCTANIPQVSVFEMADALSEGDRAKAMRLLKTLLEDQAPIALFGALVSHFRALLLSREILDEGGGPGQIQTELHKFQSAANKLAAQAARFTLPEMEALYRRLAQMDEDMKNGTMPADLALEMLVADSRP